MASIGRGRGRGFKGALGAPASVASLRRPGDATQKTETTDVPKPEPTPPAEPARDLSSELISKIKTLSLDPKEKDFVDIEKDSKDFATDRDKVEKIAQTIYDRCLEDVEFSVAGASLCERLLAVEADNVKFRSCILKLIQADYKEKESIEKESKSKFICYTSILCQIFGRLKVNNEPMKPLVGPVYECLEMLLDHGAGDEIECFNMQMQTIGRSLDKLNNTRMKSMMSQVRIKIISSNSSPRQRCLLLEVMELCMRGWKNHEPEMARFYSDLLMDLQATEILN